MQTKPSNPMNHALRCLLGGALTLFPQVVLAQTSTGPTWSQIANQGPFGRHNLAMCYDSLRGRIVMYGGNTNTQIFADTWEWDGSLWLPQIFATGPGPRESHAMAYDAARAVVVLYGGNAGSVRRGDTWTWNGSQWTQVATDGPGLRIGHSMVYDSLRQRTVMFGGVIGSAMRGDTWEWDGSSWQLRSSTGPSPRVRTAMCYDSRRGRTVLFSGQSGSGSLRDTWEWDGVSWQQRSNSGPSDRFGAGMAYNDLRGRSVLFGHSSLLDDTWEWNGSTWTQLAITGPGPRAYTAMAHDTLRGMTIVFGGLVNNAYPRETLALGYRSAATAYGNGCGNPNLSLAAAGSSVPSLGTTARVEVGNIPSTTANLMMGWSRTQFGFYPLPLTLTGFGMTGCELLQSSEFSLPATSSSAGTASYELAIPNWGGLLGIRLHLQAWAPAPGANAAGVIASNGIEWAIGNS